MNNPYLMERVKILEVNAETDIDYTYTLEYSKSVVPGQFLQISIPGVGEAPISISDYNDNKIFLTIRKVGTLTNKIFDLQAGDYLYVRGPYGNGFNLKDYSDAHVKVIAGGTGLAPVKKVIKSLMSSNDVKSVKVLAGFKRPQDILFKEEISLWEKEKVANITVDIAEENWNGNVGLITEHLELLDLSNIADIKIIVVGPPIMMKFTTLELVKRGIPEENIWVSFERKMSCGIGKCGHCKIDETYVCLEGPVFKYIKAKKLID